MRRGRSTRRLAAILALPLWLCALGAGAARGQAAGSPPVSDNATVERLEKQVFAFEDRLDRLQIEESELQMATMKAEWAAARSLAEPGKAGEQMAKGALSPELRRYRDAVLRGVQQWQAFRGRFVRFAATVRPLEHQREGLPPRVRAKINNLLARVQAKDRSLLVKLANLYEKVAEYRSAMAARMTIYKAMPPDRRAGERAFTEKIADLAEKCGDYRTALTLIRSVVEARSEKDRYGDKRLGERLGDLYAQSGDPGSAFQAYKATFEAIDEKSRYGERGLGEKLGDLCEQSGCLADAMALYRRLYDAIPEDKREQDGAGLAANIAALERRLGNP
ncbi:MAG: hypothetical protein IMZ66_08830 [Planctomycetes bacterium]|nr:hypothetical protein [Planctomycetota bacterium]